MGQNIRLLLGKVESQRRGETKRMDSGGGGASTSLRSWGRGPILPALAALAASNQSADEALTELFSAQGPDQDHMREGRRAKELTSPGTAHSQPRTTRLLLVDKDPSFPPDKLVFPGSRGTQWDLAQVPTKVSSSLMCPALAPFSSLSHFPHPSQFFPESPTN